MVLTKNYETVSTFVEVMQKITVTSFFQTRCIYTWEGVGGYVTATQPYNDVIVVD